MTDKKYAQLLLDYSLDVKAGDKVYIRSTMLAEPLLRELYREGTMRGAYIVIDVSFSGESKLFLDHANDDQLAFISPNFETAMKTFDAYLFVRAPYNLREDQNADHEKRKKRSKALSEINQIYYSRTGSGDMVRSLCQYPTQASAQEAGMSLEEYRDFVFRACKLDEEDPKAAWLEVRKNQQAYVDHLNNVEEVRYVNAKTDIKFSVKDRIWINSDGRTNMPSGEIFSGPVEDSVNGYVHFEYPSIYMGTEVSGITLKVQDGLVIEWGATVGKSILDKVFETEGARRFGEVAIGTNYSIQTPTKNILFDEKMGGTIHMAVGQSYKHTGGKNESPIHWDLIADMRDGGQIYTDGNLIYENGKFISL